MKLLFDYRFFNFLSKLESQPRRTRKLYSRIAKILRYKVIICPLAIFEKVLGFILRLLVPIYSNLVYLFVKHCTGFLGYYLRAAYYSGKARKWGGNIIVDEDVIFENIEHYEFDEFIQIDKRVVIGCEHLEVGRGVHIAMGTIIGKGGNVILRDFSGISYGCILIPASESSNRGNRTGSMIPYGERCIKKSIIHLEKESLIYSGCIIFPNVYLAEGAVCSAGMIVNKDIGQWKIAFPDKEIDRVKITTKEPDYET